MRDAARFDNVAEQAEVGEIEAHGLLPSRFAKVGYAKHILHWINSKFNFAIGEVKCSGRRSSATAREGRRADGVLHSKVYVLCVRVRHEARAKLVRGRRTLRVMPVTQPVFAKSPFRQMVRCDKGRLPIGTGRDQSMATVRRNSSVLEK
jgi:hypothetical protein